MVRNASCGLADFRADAETNKLGTASGKIEIYSEAIAGYGYDDCLGHPAWLEPVERLGGANSDRYPLHLLSPQPERRLHSQLDQTQYSQAGKVQGKEVLTMHPRTAATRGIEVGSVVRVFNDRGACLAGVALVDDMLEDVVILPTGAWFEPDLNQNLELNGNPNVLTLDVGTSKLGQGCSANTCLVEVEPFTD